MSDRVPSHDIAGRVSTPQVRNALNELLDHIYERNVADVERWVRRLVGPGLDVEDIVHDVFLVAVRRRGDFRGDASLKTWLVDPHPREAMATLATAIRKLRVDGDAASALRLLDEGKRHFANGTLDAEASAVRVEALLKLGRSESALSDLERLRLDGLPRRDEWYVVRGELRAQMGKWPVAEADFSAALVGRRAGGDLAERALWGRAAARSHRGDLAGARADAAEYLGIFPTGRFAAQARQTLPAAATR
jgi:DNA-directed RNA polymerase specialized sigma24 family protein